MVHEEAPGSSRAAHPLPPLQTEPSPSQCSQLLGLRNSLLQRAGHSTGGCCTVSSLAFSYIALTLSILVYRGDKIFANIVKDQVGHKITLSWETLPLTRFFFFFWSIMLTTFFCEFCFCQYLVCWLSKVMCILPSCSFL